MGRPAEASPHSVDNVAARETVLPARVSRGVFLGRPCHPRTGLRIQLTAAEPFESLLILLPIQTTKTDGTVLLTREARSGLIRA